MTKTPNYPPRPKLAFGVLDGHSRELTEGLVREGYRPGQIGFYMEHDPYQGVYPNREDAERLLLPHALTVWENNCLTLYAGHVLDPFRSMVGQYAFGFSRYSDALYFYHTDDPEKPTDNCPMMEIMFNHGDFSAANLPSSYEKRYKIIDWNDETRIWKTECGLEIIMRWSGNSRVYGGENVVKADKKLYEKFKEILNDLA